MKLDEDENEYFNLYVCDLLYECIHSAIYLHITYYIDI